MKLTTTTTISNNFPERHTYNHKTNHESKLATEINRRKFRRLKPPNCRNDNQNNRITTNSQQKKQELKQNQSLRNKKEEKLNW